MVRIPNTEQFQRLSHSHVNQRQPQADEDDFGILDDSILDSDAADMSPSSLNRKESFAENARVFSSTGSPWSSYRYGPDQVALQSSDHAVQSLIEHGNNNVFPGHGAPQGISYPNQTPAWHLSGTSGSCTPTADYENISSDYANSMMMMPSYSHGTTNSSTAATTFDGPHVQTTPLYLANLASSTSPQSGKDWASISSSEQLGEWSTSAQPHPNSPFHPGSLQNFRRDGIRKKNARFEIPAERNLRTIDHLINQTNDEQEIKELKQQKRLLRNRQAALDSRQRKKQHTERLEEEKKHFTTIITELEEALGEMKLRETEWVREKESRAALELQYKQYIDTLIMEKEELVRCHTIESGELRKKNSFLVGQLQRMEGSAMSTAPSSTGFSADFSDFDHLTMHSSPWENYSVVNDFSIETEPQPLAASATQAKTVVRDDDRAATSGFLLLLLLCGAWVASKGSGSAVQLPQMSEDMRVASAVVLDHIYKDAGLQSELVPRPASYEAPRAKTSLSRDPRTTTLSAFEIASLSKSPLENLHHHLTSPTEEQIQAQTFSLSASQYNAVSLDSSYEHRKPLQPAGRRNLEDALAAIRKRSEGSAAEVYTRSLMWDKVPHEVVKDFARMVAATDGVAGQWKSEPMG
ncbi:MAG: hypothetical protein Q9187_001625 [Circinaria calcarea]